MPRQATRAKPTPATPAFVPPYPPSWVDRMTDAVDRVPGPAWLTYVLLGAALVIFQLGVQLMAGNYNPGPVLQLHLTMFASPAYVLALIHYLDRLAGRAIEAFRPVLELPTEPAPGSHLTYDDLRYRLTTLPARPASWLAILGGIAITLMSMFLYRSPTVGRFSLPDLFHSFRLSAAPLPVALLILETVLFSALITTLVYHTVHQLHLIQHIFADHTRLNLYQIEPIYAFSVPVAFTAAGFLVLTYALFAAGGPLLAQSLPSVGLYVFLDAFAIITFLLPLWGIHQKLVQEKKRLLKEASEWFEGTVAELHHRLGRRSLTRMDDLNKALASLELEQAALRRIPTWPWEPGTLRAVLAALVLPIAVWLIQNLLQRLLG